MPAGRRRKRVKSFAETSNVRRRVSNRLARQRTELADLPIEVLELILTGLCLRDNIRASAVSRRWLDAASFVRKSDRPPWLMHLPKSGELTEFYDPLKRKTYCLKLPMIKSCKVCYSKFGWLLFYKPSTHRVFFIHPYTQEKIKFPKIELAKLPALAFSAPPTSPNCIVFALNHVNLTVFEISICRPGNTEWTTTNFNNELPFMSGIWRNIVFSKGLFYCLSLTGRLGIYNPEGNTWSILSVRLPPDIKCFEVQWWKGKFLAEHNGDIFVGYACHNVNPLMFKLDEANNQWEQTTDLGGMTIFAHYVTSQFRTELLGKMRNTLYFPKVQYYGKRCFTYSLDAQRYHPRKEGFDLDKQDLFENVWIDAPEDLSVFL